jgi:predicted peroxiredoxin
VYLYVQGTAVHILKKGYRGYLPGWQRPFSFFARRVLEATGHDQATVKFSKVQKLGTKLYACHPSIDAFGVTENDLAYHGVVLGE